MTRHDFAMAALVGGFATFLQEGDAWNGYEDFAESCWNMADVMMRVGEKRARAK